EAAGPFAVVLQEESIVIELAEDLLGNPVVPALGKPATAIVAPAHVQAERHTGARESGDDRVVGGDGLVDTAIRADPELLPLTPSFLVGVVEDVADRVDLHVRHAVLDECRDLAMHGSRLVADHIGLRRGDAVWR